jgi:DNA-binding NtrC family response regulator
MGSAEDNRVYAPVCILIYGYDAVLLTTRRLVLEKEGFNVLTATYFNSAVTFMESEAIDLFIVCVTVKDGARSKALAAAHTVRPTMRNLIQVEQAHPSTDERDTFVEHFLSPEALLASVKVAVAA